MLKDARGYRSPYINALNGAVAAARVVGGDVIPEETPSGTILTIAQTRRAGRFELFCGYDNGGESGADAFCLSEGTLYVSAVAQELKPGREVFRRDGDLQPRANGWCTRKTITDGQALTFACVRYDGEYYLIAQKDGEKASELLPESLGTVDETKLEELFTFGQFYWAGATGDKSIRIRQDVHGDVWYGGSGETKAETPFIHPFQCALQKTGGVTYTLSIRKGHIFPVSPATSATQILPELDSGISESTDPDSPYAWTTLLTASGSLYIVSRKKEDSSTAYFLTIIPKEGDTVQAIICAFSLPTSGSDSASLTQHLLQDLVIEQAPNTFALGPIQWLDSYTSQAATNCLAQYAGHWRLINGAWTFAPENATPAVIYPSAKLSITFRENNRLRTIPAYLLTPTGEAPADWLSIVDISYAKSVDYTPPADETQQGALTRKQASIPVLAEAAPTESAAETLLSTEVESANESKTYGN